MGRLEVAKNSSGKQVFVWRGTYEEKDYPKGAGFRWDPDAKVWYTHDPERAAKLIRFAADSSVKETIQKALSVDSWNGEISSISLLYPESLRPFPYQEEGARHILHRKSLLLADDMGLGKTVQVLLAVNSDPSIRKVLIFCPASVKINWVREAKRWLVRPFEVSYLSGKKAEPLSLGDHHLLVVNYDIASSWMEEISRYEWDLVVLDEAHYLKNPKAQRTQAILGEKVGKSPLKTRMRVALTGTPVVNRPVEAWPVLSWLDPKSWGNFWAYVRRYCGAHHNGWGWDFSGATNLEELNRRLRATVMLRRTKDQVLTDLPPKIRQVLEVSPEAKDLPLIRREREVWEEWEERIAEARAALEVARAGSDEEFAQALASFQKVVRVAFQEVSRVRHEVALAKVPYAVQHIEDLLESKSKIVVWVHHRDVAEAIFRSLRKYSPVMVLGGASAEARAEAVRRFQEDPSVRVFVGGITAAAEGITLTASDLAVFVEMDWRPGKLLQAEDRIHRIGQSQSVLIQYLVFDGSLDAAMAHKVSQKMEIIARALGSKETSPTLEEEVLVLSAPEELPPAEGNESLPEESDSLSDSVVSLLHGYVRKLASMDQDRATFRNGLGFNRFDSHLGHKLAALPRLTPRQASLALKLVRKYRRQLQELGLLQNAPEEISRLVFG